MKVCTGCGRELPEENFFFKDKQRNRRQAKCKDCYKVARKATFARHYAKYRHEYVARSKARNSEIRDALLAQILEYLASHPCSICGESDPVVLEFHHRDPKNKDDTVASLVRIRASSAKVMAEIEKCDVLCANCHKRVTANQFGWRKARVDS